MARCLCVCGALHVCMCVCVWRAVCVRYVCVCGALYVCVCVCLCMARCLCALYVCVCVCRRGWQACVHAFAHPTLHACPRVCVVYACVGVCARICAEVVCSSAVCMHAKPICVHTHVHVCERTHVSMRAHARAAVGGYCGHCAAPSRGHDRRGPLPSFAPAGVSAARPPLCYTHSHTDTRTHVHAHIPTCTRTRTRIRTRTWLCTQAHTHSLTLSRAHAHACMGGGRRAGRRAACRTP